MANKRVSELAPITAAELQAQDLLLLADVTAHESKKLALSDLSVYLLLGGFQGNFSGSFFGTASWAYNAVSASYAPPQISASYASTSSWAYNAITASAALNALSSSYSLSSSYAITASFALTSSVQLIYSSAYADFAKTASYLLFVPGQVNGTASFALTSSVCLGSASFATSASHALFADFVYSGVNASSSWASASYQAQYATSSLTASFLNYDGTTPNGTASYALIARTFTGVMFDYGVFLSLSQSNSASAIDSVKIAPSTETYQTTSIEAYGNIYIYVPLAGQSGSISLITVDRASGITNSLDSAPVYSQVGGTNGTLNIPFSLKGQASLSGSVIVSVTSSVVGIEPTRIVRFGISSFSDHLSVVPTTESMDFTAIPINTTMSYTSSLDPTQTFQGSSSYIIQSGSGYVIQLDASFTSITSMKYVWTLGNLTSLNVSFNPSLTDIGGVPYTLQTMSAQNCAFTELYPLSHTAVSILNCSYNNSLTSVPVLPPTMSSIDAQHNPLVTSMPTIPYGTTTLRVNNCALTSAAADAITNQLVANNQNNGLLDISNNGITYSGTTTLNFGILTGRGWTIIS